MGESAKCLVCGEVQEESANYCKNCGEKLSKIDAESAPLNPISAQASNDFEFPAIRARKKSNPHWSLKFALPLSIVIILVAVFAISTGSKKVDLPSPSEDSTAGSTPTPTTSPIPTDPLSLDYIQWFKPTLSEYRAALSRMTIKTDSIQGITWAEPKTAPSYSDVNHLWAYVGCTDSGSCKPGSMGVLRLKIQFGGTDWLFITEYHFNIDGDNATYDFNLDYGDVKRDNSNGRVWEYYDSSAEPTSNLDYFNLIQTLADSKNAVYRASGDQHYQDFVVTQSEKSALKDALTVWFGLNNGVKAK